MIGAIVLAAGHSRRMGTQKLLLPLAGRTLIGRVIDEVRSGAVDHVVVVVSQDEAAVRQELADQPVALVINPNPEGEMLSSVRCGLRALPAGCAAAMVVLGDQPGVNAALVRDVIRKFRETGGIVVPAHRGRRGHPTLFAARYFDEVLTRHDGVGLHGLLKAHLEDVHELEIADPAALDDIDHPDDYRRELNR